MKEETEKLSKLVRETQNKLLGRESNVYMNKL